MNLIMMMILMTIKLEICKRFGEPSIEEQVRETLVPQNLLVETLIDSKWIENQELKPNKEELEEILKNEKKNDSRL